MQKVCRRVIKWAAIAGFIALAFASCDINGLTGISANSSGLSAKGLGNSNQMYDSEGNLLPRKIAGTAGIGENAFFFEFDIYGTKRFASALLPISSDGYIKNGKILYNKERFALTSFVFDKSSGYMTGSTATVAGVSFAFEGTYSLASGFFGTISKTTNGVVVSGYFGGTPVFDKENSANYIGKATYLFPTPTPQTLIFNAVIDSNTGKIVGTWSEVGVGWPYTLHGSIGGTRVDDTININATVLPMFRSKMLFDMTATGTGTFKDGAEKTISGEFIIQYGSLTLPSTLTAVRETE